MYIDRYMIDHTTTHTHTRTHTHTHTHTAGALGRTDSIHIDMWIDREGERRGCRETKEQRQREKQKITYACVCV